MGYWKRKIPLCILQLSDGDIIKVAPPHILAGVAAAKCVQAYVGLPAGTADWSGRS